MVSFSGIFAALSVYATLARASTVWSGSFNSYSTSAAFDQWSWSNEVGEYQWYIHGTQPTSHYLSLDPTFKNPADTSETQGIKMTIDNTALWNGQTMARTELIPQTTQNLGVGTMFYHFSIMHSATNPPDFTLEHQICFFESHFTELKIGVAPNPGMLQWMAAGQEHWSTSWVAGTWYNFAYEINFSGNTAGLWASTGSSPLTKVVQNVPVSASTNSEDWHLGILRVIGNAGTEDYFFSGVYIENGSITTSVGNGAGSGSGSSGGGSGTTSAPTTTAPTSTPTTVSSTSSASGATQTQWGQCGGTGWAGATACSGGHTCIVMNPYYSQCQ